MSFFSYSVAVALLLCLIFHGLNSEVLYVSNQGNDNNSGDPNLPLKTLQGVFQKYDQAQEELTICLIGTETINGTFRLEKDLSLTSLNITTCQPDILNIDWDFSSSGFNVKISQIYFFHVTITAVGQTLFQSPDIYSITTRDVTVYNPQNTIARFQSELFLSENTNWRGPVAVVVTLLLSMNMSQIHGMFFAQAATSLSSTLIISGSFFQDINDTSPLPAAYFSSFSSAVIDSSIFSNNEAGVVFANPPLSTYEFLNITISDNRVRETSFFTFTHPEEVTLQLRGGNYGCSLGYNDTEVRPFQSTVKSVAITEQPPEFSCLPPEIRPGYDCENVGPCSPCLPGFYWNQGSARCVLCPDGTFNTVFGSLVCTPCLGNSVSSPDRTFCSVCNNGRAENNECKNVSPTAVPEPPARQDNTYKILLIVVNIIFAIVVAIVAISVWSNLPKRTSGGYSERRSLINQKN